MEEERVGGGWGMASGRGSPRLGDGVGESGRRRRSYASVREREIKRKTERENKEKKFYFWALTFQLKVFWAI